MSNQTIVNGSFFFDPDDPIYQSHFPSFPVVPGSLLVGRFLQTIKEMKDNPEMLVIKTFTFKGFTTPGICNYSIEMTDTQIKCQLFQDNSLKAKGVITYAS
jgi:3-hydroxymyristoyl/3-hydroxydecanoyl-(acyl carrier protein) dehydratase